MTSSPFNKSKSPDNKYMLGDEIGKGAYARVYKGLDLKNGDFVAIKQVSLENVVQDDDLNTIMQEIDLLKNLNHKNIVKYLGSWKTKTHLHIILEYVENGSLANNVKPNKFGPFPESLVAVYIAQVLEGLVYLHEQGVIHRDIKGANILTTKEGLVKLADFGVATKLNESEFDTNSVVGSPYWMAPEVIELIGVCAASDIWSVGCTVIELLTCVPPYFDMQPSAALYRIVQDDSPPIPDSLSPDITDFLRQCFKKDSRQRPDAKTLLSHPWIRNSRRALQSSLRNSEAIKYMKEAAASSEKDDEGSQNVTESLSAEKVGMSKTQKASEHYEAPGNPETEASIQVDQPSHSLVQKDEDHMLRKAVETPSRVGGNELSGFSNTPGNEASTSMPPSHAIKGYSPVADGGKNDGGDPFLLMMGVLKDDVVGIDGLVFNENVPAENLYPLQAVEFSRLVSFLRPDESEDAIVSSSEKLVVIFRQRPVQKAVFVTQHGFLPLMDLLDAPKSPVIYAVLQLINETVKDNTEFKENACLVGLIPVVMNFAGSGPERDDHSQEIRMEAAYFLQQLCQSSSTLQMFIACGGIPVLVGFIEADYAKHREMVHLAIDGMWQVFKLKKSTPINDFCRIAAKSGILPRLINTLVSLNEATRLASTSGGPLSVDGQAPQAHSGQLGQLESSLSVIDQPDVLTTSHGCGEEPSHDPSTSDSQRTDIHQPDGDRPRLSSVAALATEKARPGSTTSICSLAHMVSGDVASEYLEKVADLLLVFARADTTVKSHMCSQSLLILLFQMFNRVESPILLKILECINHLSTDPDCLETLQRANAIKHLIPNLDLKEGNLVYQIHHEVLSALFNLCKINKRRQEQAAEHGIIPHLMHFIMSASSLKQYALPLLCDMAHASHYSREQLRAHGGLDVYMSLLDDESWSVIALDSLAVCLAHDNDSNHKVEQALLKKDAVQKLVRFFKSCPERHFVHILEPFLKIITKSYRINKTLAVNGLTSLLVSRLDHQDAIVRLNLLKLIKAVYEHHPKPKQLIVENDLPQKLQNLIGERRAGQSSGGQVLVKQMATSLLKALYINTVL
ncbi:MAP3K epsilon protein kinase 1 isoform X1 [Brassica napus]|uniref:non-specific serine/threonine protein kinase n=1 Tax=Brassica oleracea var. oleracea TaxID=109376 RepID=A0A0D3ADZ0_BRAOL|nr:PREDICTED: MAP3K epsilon protein kinase 1-like isoform X1 [Brassica oleracea var. oleracea]XP_013673129.1 MAP3K epsilon protein kinase 1 isoform X1 [Brassica napus]XP_048600584.1 MAP3K epsilon protein kinase 1 isoform X1 [Brassica napus]